MHVLIHCGHRKKPPERCGQHVTDLFWRNMRKERPEDSVLEGIVLDISIDRRAFETSETTHLVIKCRIPEQPSIQ